MDISEITDYLYVGGQPAHTACADLGGLNVGLVINMRGESRPHAAFGAPPLKLLWLRTAKLDQSEQVASQLHHQREQIERHDALQRMFVAQPGGPGKAITRCSTARYRHTSTAFLR